MKVARRKYAPKEVCILDFASCLREDFFNTPDGSSLKRKNIKTKDFKNMASVDWTSGTSPVNFLHHVGAFGFNKFVIFPVFYGI